MIYFITGGQRSGKSSFAQRLALSLSDHPVYLATARVWDEDFRQRIERHQSERGDQWENLEEEVHLSKALVDGRTVVVDCITLWLTNIFTDYDFDVDVSLDFAREELNRLLKQDADFIFISNEIGMGVHPESQAGRKFVDAQGMINQYVASLADTVVFMVSGIPQVIKGKIGVEIA